MYLIIYYFRLFAVFSSFTHSPLFSNVPCGLQQNFLVTLLPMWPPFPQLAFLAKCSTVWYYLVIQCKQVKACANYVASLCLGHSIIHGIKLLLLPKKHRYGQNCQFAVLIRGDTGIRPDTAGYAYPAVSHLFRIKKKSKKIGIRPRYGVDTVGTRQPASSDHAAAQFSSR